MGYQEARGKRRPLLAFVFAISYYTGAYYLQGFKDGISPVLAAMPELNDSANVKLLRELEIIE